MVRVAVVDFVRIGSEPPWRYLFRAPPEGVEFVDGAPADVVIYADWGRRHREILRRSPGARAVYYTGESFPPRADAHASLTMHPSPGPRNYQAPLWAVRAFVRSSPSIDWPAFVEEMRAGGWRRPFCGSRAGACFVMSNRVEARESLVRRVSRLFPVTCAGKSLNNTGTRAANKLDVLRGHLFDFSFENKRQEGYVTEKIFDAYAAGCIPVYWGAPDVSKHFRPSTFIDASQFPDAGSLADRLVEVSSDPAEARSFFAEPILSDAWLAGGGDRGREFADWLKGVALGETRSPFPGVS